MTRQLERGGNGRPIKKKQRWYVNLKTKQTKKTKQNKNKKERKRRKKTKRHGWRVSYRQVDMTCQRGRVDVPVNDRLIWRQLQTGWYDVPVTDRFTLRAKEIGMTCQLQRSGDDVRFTKGRKWRKEAERTCSDLDIGHRLATATLLNFSLKNHHS